MRPVRCVFFHDSGAAPPAAAQCLIKRRRITEAIGLRLYQINDGQLIALFRGKLGLVANGAHPISLACEVECGLRRLRGGGDRFECACVRLYGV